MSRCPSCGEPIHSLQESCPACSRSPDLSDVATASDAMADNDESMVTVARFANAAEAGYFAEELSHHSGIRTLLRSDKTFNALSGYWSQRFDLRVPQADVDKAEASLRRLIGQTGDGETLSEDRAAGIAPHDDSLLPYERFEIESVRPERLPEGSGIHWIPIVLTLTVGTVAFWAARRIHNGVGHERPAAPAELSTSELWDRLSAAPQPWRQTMPGGRGVRELRFDSRRQRVEFREDADGDGFFEHKELLHRPLPK